MPRLNNRTPLTPNTANLKVAIDRQAKRDLRELELARRQANLLGQNQKRRINGSTSRPTPVNQPSSSSDSEDEVETIPKVPKIESNAEDDVVVIEELSAPTLKNQNIVPAINRALVDVDESEQMNCSDSAESSNIIGFLNEEIKAESHEENASLQGVSKPKITDFEIIEDQAQVKLIKMFKNEKIQITFNVNNTLCLPTNEATSSISLPSPTVEVIKGHNRLCFNLVLKETEKLDMFDFRIESFYHLPIIANEENKLLDKNDPRVYQLSLNNCSDQLHEQLRTYLNERGIGQRLLNQLINFSTFYEHERYVELLTKTRDFIQQKM